MAFDDGDNLDDLELDFVPAEVKREFDLLPAGWTAFDVEDIKPQWNDAQDVMSLVIKLRIPEGEENGRKVLFARHVGKIADPTNEKAAKRLKFGREALGELARAAGVAGSNLAPAIGQRVMGNVKVAPENNGYPAKNEVTAYKPIVAAPKAAPKPTAAAKPAVAAKPAASPPSFMKKAKPAPAPEPEVDDGDESADD